MRVLAALGLCMLSLFHYSPVRAAEAYPDFVEEVYLAPEQALAKVFPGADEVKAETVRLAPAQRSAVERRLGWRLPDEEYVVHKGFKGGAFLGYAVITEEVGKYKPITFIVKTDPERRVDAVEVLVYREPRGGEVRKPRFLRQLRGKRADSPLRINRDVINITGATLSVRAMSAGVKKVLCVLEEAYK